jgi:phage/plasmid primase-like uncharacterized protein/archaellum biogenesis ATPase FlaH
MIAELFDAMLDNGYTPPSFLNPTGEVTRFNVGTGKQNKDGWITVFLDGKGAVFGDWKTGNKYTWFESSVVQENTETVAERNAAMQRAVDERERRYRNSAIEAQSIYDNAISCDNHAYLSKKAITACDRLRIATDGRLIVPVFDKNETLQSIQYIDNDGNKRFLTDGRMKGGCFVIGELDRGKKALMVEGLATGLTVHDATGIPVIVAFNAGNLKTVHDNFKSDVTITICADNDQHGKGEKSAIECGCDYVIPPQLGDFNDVGVDKTRELLKHLIPKQDVKKPFLVTIEQLLTDIKPIDWLMKGIMERGSIGIMFGESGAGKSLFALDWVCCLANGTDWHGFKVREPKKVVYVCGEGGRGIASRVQAIKQKYNTRIKNNAYFSTKSVDLLSAKSVKQITDAVTNFDIVPDILVFDTLHKSMTGDENSSKDIAVLFAAIAELQDLYGCAVLIVHHSGLADKMRQRGSSSIKAGVDFEYCITKNNDFELSISCTKMKDCKKMQPMKFVITPTPLEGEQWIDEDDEVATSVYLTYDGIDTEKSTKLSARDEAALNALKMALNEGGSINTNDKLVVGNENVNMVRVEVFRTYFDGTCKGKNKRRDFDLSLDVLKKRKYIGFENNWAWVIEE